jgi:DNA-binding protein YbaB
MIPARDPDEAQASIQQWADGFAAKARRYQEAAERTEELRLTATSHGGLVTVTVRADGGVTDIEFGEKASGVPLSELSAMILDTMHRAQSRIADQVSEVYAEELGDEDPRTRSLMLTNLRERFPAAGEESEVDEPAEPDDYSDADPLR